MGEITTEEFNGMTLYGISLCPEFRDVDNIIFDGNKKSSGIYLTRIDNVVVEFDMDRYDFDDIEVCGCNINVMRIMSGMAGLAYCS